MSLSFLPETNNSIDINGLRNIVKGTSKDDHEKKTMRVYEYVHNRTLWTASTITNISVVFMTKRKLECFYHYMSVMTR